MFEKTVIVLISTLVKLDVYVIRHYRISLYYSLPRVLQIKKNYHNVFRIKYGKYNMTTADYRYASRSIFLFSKVINVCGINNIMVYTTPVTSLVTRSHCLFQRRPRPQTQCGRFQGAGGDANSHERSREYI